MNFMEIRAYGGAEAHMKAGDTVLIPVPVEEVLSLFNFGSR